MASAADYVFNRAPTAADFPQFNGDWISRLPNDYWQGQQYAYQRNLQNMFQGPQGQQMLQQSGIPTNSLLGGIIQRGGAQYALPVAGAILNSQLYDQTVNGGGNYPAAPTGGSDPRGMVPWIVSEAKRLGIDPGTAVKVAASEGLSDYTGDNGTSFGAFQLHLTGRKGGALGDEFREETGLDPRNPKNEKAMITWSLENLRRTGWQPYHGAAHVGIGSRAGIGSLPQEEASGGRSDQLNPTDRTAVNAMYGQPGVAQPGTGAPAPVEQPAGATGNAPFMVAAGSQQAGSPASMGMRSANAAELNPDTNQTTKAVSTTEASQGSPERIARAAGNTDTSTPGPAASSPPPPGTASANAPQNRATPQGPSPTTGQEGEVPPGYTRAAVAARRQYVASIRARAGYIGQRFGKEAQSAEEAKAVDQEKQADTIEKFLNEREQQQFGVGIKQREKQNEADVAQYNTLHKGLAGAGMTAANSLQYTQQAKGLINAPEFYSGSAEQVVLGYRRALAGLGIDPGGALPQEAFRKVMAANILQQINALKAEAESMGQTGGRIFASQIDLMEKAAQNPDNSIAANRYLTEVAERSANRTLHIADMADDYKKANGSLDAGFEKQVRNWIVKNPIFTKEEMANPQLIGAPKTQAPQGAPKYKQGQTAVDGSGRMLRYDEKSGWMPAL